MLVVICIAYAVHYSTNVWTAVGKTSGSVDGNGDGGAASSGWEYPSAQCVFIYSIDVEHMISKVFMESGKVGFFSC